MGNEVFNIFSLTVSSKKVTFLEKMGKEDLGAWPFFWRDAKNECNPFYQKFDAKYFHVK